MWRTILIDDEEDARRHLRSLLASRAEIEIVAEASSVREAMELCESTRPNLVFLDVEMPDGNGFDLLPKLGPQTRVIFVSAYSVHAVRAFEVNAMDYLTKPVFAARLNQALARLGHTKAPAESAPKPALKREDSIFLQDGKSYHMVKLSSITTIRSEGNYTIVKTRDSQEVWVLRSMSEWENTLPNDTFIRIDRSLIVNLHHVKGFGRASRYSGHLEIDGQSEPIPLGRTALNRIRAVLSERQG